MDNPTVKTSAESESIPTSTTFTGSCECINNINFDYPLTYNEYDPAQYMEVELKKTEQLISEVEKHTDPKPQAFEKPCYKKDHTTALLLVDVKKKQKRTLLSFRQELDRYPFKKKCKIPFGLHGKPAHLCVEEYMDVMEHIIQYAIVSTRSFKKANSKCPIDNYLISLKSLKSTLNFLKQLIVYKGEENKVNL